MIRPLTRLWACTGIVAGIFAAMAGFVAAEEVKVAQGALLRGLDKVNGETIDLNVPNGGTDVFGDLVIDMGECRYPIDNATGDAFAFISIRQNGKLEPLFQGWMIASAPALNALDHARYDVWVLRCNISDAD